MTMIWMPPRIVNKSSEVNHIIYKCNDVIVELNGPIYVLPNINVSVTLTQLNNNDPGFKFGIHCEIDKIKEQVNRSYNYFILGKPFTIPQQVDYSKSISLQDWKHMLGIIDKWYEKVYERQSREEAEENIRLYLKHC